MAIYATNGAQLYVGGVLAQKSSDFVESDFTPQAWVEIGEIEGLGSVGDTATEITFDSIDASRTRRLKGTRNAGTMDVVCGIDYADAGQMALLAAESAHEAGRHGFYTELTVRQGIDPVTAAKAGRWSDVTLPLRAYGHAEADEGAIRELVRTGPVHDQAGQRIKRLKANE